jgi:hypothetical protein
MLFEVAFFPESRLRTVRQRTQNRGNYNSDGIAGLEKTDQCLVKGQSVSNQKPFHFLSLPKVCVLAH